MAAGARVLDSLYISGFGTAAASGTVSFYGVGTLVSAPVYSDEILSTIQVQPITLDANGKTPLPVFTATPLRCIIKSAAGATLQDISRVDGDRAELVGVSNAGWTATDLNTILTAIQTSTGGIDGKFLDSGAGAVARTLQAKFNEVQISVKDYGAVGNGIADDTSAVQAAINRVTALGGGVVYLPPGTYLISSALSVAAAGVDLRGSGQRATIITQSNATANGITLTGAAIDNLISDLSIAHSSTSTGAAISAAGPSHIYLSRVTTSTIAFRTALSGFLVYAVNCNIGANTSDAAGSAGTVTTLYSANSSFSGYGGLTVTTSLLAVNTIVQSVGAGSTAVTINATAECAACTFVGILHGLAVAAGVTQAVNIPASINSISPDILDSRAASTAPVGYSLATSQAITPTPLQTSAIRVIATAAITVTVSAIAATGFGCKWSMICSNASGGAVTWTFNAQYVLSGAVAPATGNRVNLILEYNPIDGKVYEMSRAATAN